MRSVGPALGDASDGGHELVHLGPAALDGRWIASGSWTAAASVMSALWRDGPTVARSATPVVPEPGSVTVDALRERRHECRPLGREVREGGVAGRIRGAPGDQQVERVLAGRRHELQDGDVERRRAVHDRDADTVGVLAEVVLGELSAVGGAVQVDRLVPEGGPDGVEVVSRDAARVHARVGVEPGEALAAPRPNGARRPRRRTTRSCRASRAGSACSKRRFRAGRRGRCRGWRGRRCRALGTRRRTTWLASPGPPARANNGSGFASAATAGTTATRSPIWRPDGFDRSSGTCSVPQ